MNAGYKHRATVSSIKIAAPSKSLTATQTAGPERILSGEEARIQAVNSALGTMSGDQ